MKGAVSVALTMTSPCGTGDLGERPGQAVSVLSYEGIGR
jgi:hypothetical protein